MFNIRQFQKKDERLVLSVFTNQVWTSIKGKKPTKEFVRTNLSKSFYSYLFKDRLICVVVEFSDQNDSIISAFWIVLDSCLITCYVRKEFKDEEHLSLVRGNIFELIKSNGIDSFYLDTCKEYIGNRLPKNAIYWGIL